MKTNIEKRAFERHLYAADIAFSYFNKEYSYDAHTLNVGSGGMCFKSNLFLKPGATVYIRLKKNSSEWLLQRLLRGVTHSHPGGGKMVPTSFLTASALNILKRFISCPVTIQPPGD